MLTVVLDSNIYVSTLLVSRGVPARIYRGWRDRRFLVATSAVQLEEVARTLSYPRIRRRYAISDEAVDALISVLRTDALIVPGVRTIDDERLRDPNDAFLLTIAAESNADVLVSSDGDLLVLESTGLTRILTPRAFLDLLVSRREEPPPPPKPQPDERPPQPPPPPEIEEMGGEAPCQLHRVWDADE